MAAPAIEVTAESVWEFPDVPLRIHLRLDVVSRLREQVLQRVSPDVHRCKEIGGVLLGSAAGADVEITDFKLFRPDREDWRFVLSDIEKADLRRAIEERQADERLTAVVGYFRSDLNGQVRLSEQDQRLIEEVFPEPSHVFLVVRADESEAPQAGFFFRDGASLIRFPLNEQLLEAAPPPELPHGNESGKGLPWLLGAVCLVAMACLFAAFGFSYSEEEATFQLETRPILASPVALAASKAEKNLSITWDSRLPVVSGARVGVITIKDGDSKFEFPLNKAELHGGKLIYAPLNQRIEITMEVYSSDGATTRDSILVTSP